MAGRKIAVRMVRRWQSFAEGSTHVLDYGLGRTLVDKGWATEVAAPVDAKAISTGTVRNKAVRKGVTSGA